MRRMIDGFNGLKAVVFDMDGVLVDSEAFNVRSAFEAFAEFGHPLDSEDTRRIVGRHPVDYVPGLARRFDMDAEVQRRLVRRQDAIYNRVWREDAEALDGAAEILAWLQGRGYALALATSSDRKHAEECLARFELRQFFGLVLTLDDVSNRKPDPEVYLACARRLDVEPSAMLVVEDSSFGVEAAKRAGARCVAIRSAYTPQDQIDAADVLIDSLREIESLLG